ncbi:hypothetical protein CBER1_09549 [Cercospora berteroae]|uniref:Amidase domain-containing protein n=1 Tax=Cercospora berteroae TaxID=357750 RepID=A0A2S6BXU8_9PEZI|nr:hypothetical protein CBER1_09549 [Cercospora berteroae]
MAPASESTESLDTQGYLQADSGQLAGIKRRRVVFAAEDQSQHKRRCSSSPNTSSSMRVEPYRLTATEAIKTIGAGDLTVEEYARSLLDRIKERDDAVRAWIYLDGNQVLEQARALDMLPKEERGPLHGVAVAIKDVIYTKGTENHVGGKRSNELILVRHAHTAQFGNLQR